MNQLTTLVERRSKPEVKDWPSVGEFAVYISTQPVLSHFVALQDALGRTTKKASMIAKNSPL
ncbi:hypothetical protein ELI30_32995 (plasmid) [Rhizobium leguminosarum]|uniref:hypothetical protein n=1 Tax=Rhizobium leguminosarum TaxID=384 RepID=UPI00102F4F49|nr:hypothetical protein [Rhizobium leguminosarum]TAV41888.1 hypothetical protein ELI31_31870 [Rhizobium leguminosarum]TAV42356.1 hypothetical protein ELI32_33185 [Rhizobium leguminosarum]TAV61605.1 hypothetical protein ELI30_32995 [Rhizobium leguminosarum]TAY60927.1 hypothetical protein ELH82_31890 [Rhizobium leguminosarum]